MDLRIFFLLREGSHPEDATPIGFDTPLHYRREEEGDHD